MKRLKAFFRVLALSATIVVIVIPHAHAACPNGAVGAPCVHYVAAGTTVTFQQFALAVVNDIAPTTAGFSGPGGGTIHHFTIKGNCAGVACAETVDSRWAGPFNMDPANYWVAWVCGNVTGAVGCTGANVTDVWVYNDVKSQIGVRDFLAQPQAKSFLVPGTSTGVPGDKGQDLINQILFLHGDLETTVSANCPLGAPNCDAAFIPPDVYALINGASISAAVSDIRAEDVLYATERAYGIPPIAPPWDRLGYCGGACLFSLAPPLSSFTGKTSNSALFGLPGSFDPFNPNKLVPQTITTLPVGEASAIFLANRTDPNGLGNFPGGGVAPFYGNVVDNGPPMVVTNPSPIGLLFGGTTVCNGSNLAFGLAGAVPPTGDFPINPVLFDPLDGVMNIMEFSAFKTFGGTLSIVGGSSVSNSNFVPLTSQEANVGAINPLGGVGPNPPGTPCTAGLGKRYRAINIDEEVGSPAPVCGPGFTGVGCVQDGLGYTLFTFNKLSPLGNNPLYGYLQLDGIDGLFHKYAGGDPGEPSTGGGDQGELPVCNPTLNGFPGGCLRGDVWAGGNYFPHLIDGTYRSWAVLRAYCDKRFLGCTDSTDPWGLQMTIENAQDDIHGPTGKHPLQAVADFLPFSLDRSFGPPGTKFGDAGYVRSHYAFNAAVGGLNDQYPPNHTTPGFSILPAGLNIDLANGMFGGPEAGGDAGGCIVNAIDPSVFNVANTLITNGGTKMKFNYPALGLGTGALTGVCGPGSGAGFVGNSCVSSYLNAENSGATIAPTLGTNCGNVVGTCNPPPSGMSVAVTGFPAVDNVDNGVFQVTRILYDGQIKVRVSPTGSTLTINPAPAGVEGSANTGCAQ